MKSISLVFVLVVSCILQDSMAAPSRFALASPAEPAPTNPPSIFTLLGGGVSDLARQLRSGLESVGSQITGVINDNVKGVSDAVNTALQTGGHIANSGVKLAVGIPKIPLAFFAGESTS